METRGPGSCWTSPHGVAPTWQVVVRYGLWAGQRGVGEALLGLAVLVGAFAVLTAGAVWRYRRERRYALLPDTDPTFRDTLRAAATRVLGPDLQPRCVFLAQSGPAPNRIGLHSWPYLRFRVVVTTDHDVIVLAVPFGQYRPRRVAHRVPSTIRVMRVSGDWTQVAAAGEKLWVHDRWRSELAASTAA